jgi:hypothetical protein
LGATDRGRLRHADWRERRSQTPVTHIGGARMQRAVQVHTVSNDKYSDKFLPHKSDADSSTQSREQIVNLVRPSWLCFHRLVGAVFISHHQRLPGLLHPLQVLGDLRGLHLQLCRAQRLHSRVSLVAGNIIGDQAHT